MLRMKQAGWALLGLVALAMPQIARGGDVSVNGMRFTLPEGFSLELAAGPPLVERPITIDFDARGRLYVAESSGTNDPAEKQLAEKPHRILRLEDRDGDGSFDTRTVFADGMMFPEGTMWHDGSLYVCAPPQIWKLTDTDDDGVADRREIWFDAKTLTGCANDLHGPYLGPDGYIYWCKGAFAEQTYDRPGKPPFKTRASHIFRRKADGTGPIEPVMTGGMDNPVDVVFLANGDRIFTTTFLVNPGGGERDGMIHAMHGMIYGKEHDVIHDPVHKWTGPDKGPVLAHLGPAAPAGLARYESRVFGDAFQDNLFACLFNLHKVTRHVLTPAGGTYATTTEDFLASPEVDFHPTDVIEDADGSLLVVNTGGWYKLCCPTSQFHKPDVTGAIYRVRRTGAPIPEDARGLAIDWVKLNVESLAQLLGDPRPVVRKRAIREMAARPAGETLTLLRRLIGGDEAVRGSVAQRLSIVSVAAWAGTPETLGLLATASTDTDPVVRVAARNALATLDSEALVRAGAEVAREFGEERLGFVTMIALNDTSAASRRLGAELLGRAGLPGSVETILKALESESDRYVHHALTRALIDIGAPAETAAGLKHPSAKVRRAALVALDQMGATDRLDARRVAEWLSDEDEELRLTASWVIGRHAEWGSTLADFFRARLQDSRLSDAEQALAARQAAMIARSREIQGILAEQLGQAKRGEARVALLQAMHSAELDVLPDSWCDVIERLLSDAKLGGETLDACLALVKGTSMPDARSAGLGARLLEAARGSGVQEKQRLAALGAVPANVLKLDEGLVAFLVSMLDERVSTQERLMAADLLAHAALSDAQRIGLAKAIVGLGPMELARVLPAYESSANPLVGTALLDALEKASAGGSVRPEVLQPIVAKYPEEVRSRAEAFLKANHLDLAEQHARLEEMIKTLPAGDVRRGQAVFNGTKAACITCHAVGYVGGKVGPDLSRIGAIRTEHDLLESIAFPSASFVRSFEPVAIATRDGRVLSGIIKRDAPDMVVLTVAADKEERIARAEIEEIRPATVSVMPAGLDQQLSAEELADLVAFLKACR